MALPIMIMGESGSGKSTSLRNFQKGEVSVINVSRKFLPFKADFAVVNTDNYEQIKQLMKKAQSKTIVIDDCTYLMTNQFMRMAKVTGFQKFTDLALDFFNLIQFVINDLPNDMTVYFMGHIERDQSGNEKFKTIGKMLDEKICVEGLYTIVLKTIVTDGKYGFVTQTNGQDTVKSPMGMFQSFVIPNDLKFVNDTIRNFYGMNK